MPLGEPRLVQNPNDTLTLTPDARERLVEFQQAGLIWLVNTAVLHPRGYALAIHYNEGELPIGLSIVGDGSEPWVFDLDQAEESLPNFVRAELARERNWSAKLGVEE